MAYKFLIVGSGFSGAVLANELAKSLDCNIEVWDERDHIGGNCFTKRNDETGIMVHKYGPHIFNTDKKDIWDYVNSFVEFRPFTHRVKAVRNSRVYTLPVNLDTINQVFQKNLDPQGAKELLHHLADKSIKEPANFEEQALKFIGRELYEAFFYGYTKKQWGVEPSQLPASILKRIPVRFDYNDSYYNNPFVGIPVDGYTPFFEKLLSSPGINLKLKRKYDSPANLSEYDHVFYTGPIDAFFEYKYGRLGYRTVTFEQEIADGDHQGIAVLNYCDEAIPYTRVAEHKHFTPWEKHSQTIFFKEYSKETTTADIPYYPKRLAADINLLARYQIEAESCKNVSFLGRLATYRYMDMHHVISEALDFSTQFLQSLKEGTKRPIFPVNGANS